MLYVVYPATGLAERRDKKRIKREIVRPTDQTDNDPEQIETLAKKKAKATARKNSGLALMHGFTATNVGKNRLTVSIGLFNIRQVSWDLKVPPVLGVFNKGKASMKTQVRKKSYKGRCCCYHEFISSSEFYSQQVECIFGVCFLGRNIQRAETASKASFEHLFNII